MKTRQINSLLYPVIVILILLMCIHCCEKFHNITISDTCFKLSIKYSITINELIQLNKDVDCNHLNRYHHVCVTKSLFKRPLIQDCKQNYTITANDDCTHIANKNGITFERFLNLNPNIDCFYLYRYIGQQVCLNSTCMKYYDLDEDDTCDTISAQFNVTIGQLHAWNSNNIDCLHMGFTRLCVSKNH